VLCASSIDWGDAPTWVASIGALVVFVLAYLSWRGDVGQRHRELEESRRAQASLITAWIGSVDRNEITDRRDYNLDDTETCAAVVVANRSDRAAGEVFWTVWDEETRTRMDSGYIRFLPPQREETVFFPGPGGGDPVVHLMLTDADGVLWFRTDRVLSAREWFEHPDEKLKDPANTWDKTWDPDLVRRLLAARRDHQVLEYDDEDIRVAIYQTFASTGRAPTVHDLVGAFGGPYREMRQCLRRLADGRHLVIDSNEAIVMAHPFAAVPMGFVVAGSRTLWWGGCAWDSFALPHLLKDEPRVILATQCPACGTPHALVIGRDEPPSGDQVAHFLVPVDRMWDDVVHTCRNQRLFCDRDCVQDWLAAQEDELGYFLDLETLWRLARHWYDGRLEHGYTRRTPREASEYFEHIGLTGTFWGLAD
jgi:hypothetical protein